jgi:hypothetical protein
MFSSVAGRQAAYRRINPLVVAACALLVILGYFLALL